MPMQGQRGRSGRRGGVLLDMVHLAVGIGIVILAVLSFMDPEGNQVFFSSGLSAGSAVERSKWDI